MWSLEEVRPLTEFICAGGLGSPRCLPAALPKARGEGPGHLPEGTVPEWSTFFPPAAEPMFWEITRLRKEMSLAKLGFFPQEA